MYVPPLKLKLKASPDKRGPFSQENVCPWFRVGFTLLVMPFLKLSGAP